MAQEPPPIQFEDIPLEEARKMGRGPRMEPLLYETLKKKIQSLSDHAARIRFGPEIRPGRMRNYLLRIARELGVPVTIRKVPGGLLFWRSTDDDVQQARETATRLRSTRQQAPEVAARLQDAPRGQKTRPGRRSAPARAVRSS